MIKFIYEDESSDKEELLSLDVVEDDQFFIDVNNCLCQKVSYFSYTTIASQFKEPHASRQRVDTDSLVVKKVLPKVTKIEF